jgi:calcium-dependent protein kinase
MESIDTDGSGTIAYTEFIAATLDKSVYLKEEKLFQAFRMFDIDNSGKVIFFN